MTVFKVCISITLLIAFSSCSDVHKKPKEQVETESIPEDLLIGDKIALKVGGTFTIQLWQNSSIGLSNCWINQTKSTHLKLWKSHYVSSQKEKDGCIGCGGTEYWQFKALRVGEDTIKIKKCPTGIEQKSCDHFQEDSASYKDMQRYTSKVGRMIIVTIHD